MEGTRSWARSYWWAVAAVMAGCSSSKTPGKAKAAPSFQVTVDDSLKPRATTLPLFEDGEPRPLATVTDKSGKQTDFIENELLIEADDSSSLNDFLAQWQGQVLAMADPTAAGLTGPPTYLVRVHADGADRAGLPDRLSALNPNGGSDIIVSSQAGANLIAVGAERASGGHSVGLNFILPPAGFQDELLTESTVPSPPPQLRSSDGKYTEPYNINPAQWSYMKDGGVQDINVAKAWKVLDGIGAFDHKVRITIVDGGFYDGTDFPSPWDYDKSSVWAMDPTRPNENSCTNNTPCPWHGMNVVNTCMGQVNNGIGAAGPAGPVGKLFAIRRSDDIFNTAQAVLTALLSGAQIINMSFGQSVVASLSWALVPFDRLTSWVRAAGTLIFASAGNDNKDIDDEDCFIACWESAWYTPCENNGVTCVGSMDANSHLRRPDSNYGAHDLDISGPGFVWVAGDGSNPNVHAFGATSGASPFVAGVAALIWAAAPELSADEVETILFNTSNQGGPGEVQRWPNAYAAVIAALGDTPPEITITSPHDGNVVVFGDTGTVITFDATASDAEDGRWPLSRPYLSGGPTAISWSSDVDGPLDGHDTFASFDFGSAPEGLRHITAKVTDSAGLTSSSTIAITTKFPHVAPVPVITWPMNGTTFPPGTYTVTGYAKSSDPGDLGDVPCSRITWNGNIPSTDVPNGNGLCQAQVTFAEGIRMLTITAKGRQGDDGTDSIFVNVESRPGLFVAVMAPADGSTTVVYNQNVNLVLTGTAAPVPSGWVLSFVWSWYRTADAGGGKNVIIVTDPPSYKWTPQNSGICVGVPNEDLTIELYAEADSLVDASPSMSGTARSNIHLDCATLH